MSKWIASAFFCTGLVIACGGGSGSGGSGVSGSKKLVDLNSAEITDICEYLEDVAGPMRTITCPDGNTVTIDGNVAECVMSVTESQTAAPNCMATVDNYEGCAEAIAALSDAELCDLSSLPAACAPLLSAECTGG
jgi:hypothetical protein